MKKSLTMTRPYGAESRTSIGRIGAITWIGKYIALLVLPCLATPTKCCTFFNQAYFCEFCNEWELFLGLDERRIKFLVRSSILLTPKMNTISVESSHLNIFCDSWKGNA